MRVFFAFFFSCFSFSILGQTDSYTRLKTQFERLSGEGQWDSAIIIAKKIQENQSDTSLSYATGLRGTGICYYNLQKYDSALYYYNYALSVLEKQGRSLHPDYARGLNNLGNLFYQLGNYQSAKKYYELSLDIYIKSLGKENVNYALTLNNLGNLYRSLEEYSAAEDCLKRASSLIKKSLGELHNHYATSLNNLGILYRELGDYSTAESYSKKALEICRKTLGEESPEYSLCLNNLGILYQELRSFDQAESYLKQSLAIGEKIFGTENTEYGLALINLGSLYQVIKDYPKAERNYKNALDIYVKVLGPEHPDCAVAINNLGVLYASQGDYKAAESYYLKALNIYRKIFSEDHPEFISTQNSYADLLIKTNHEREAYEIFKTNFIKTSKTISDQFEWLSDNQKEAYWKKEEPFFEHLSLFADQFGTKVPESIALNYDAALLTRSKLLESKISLENYYREIDAIRDDLAYRRRLLAKMESDGSDDREKMDVLRQEADSLDKQLVLSWPEYSRQKKNLSITWRQVQQNLDTGEAAIEFVRFRNEQDSLVYYNALLIRQDEPYPRLIKLCNEEALKNISPNHGFSAYYPLLWEPLNSSLQGVKTVYYSPVGMLCNVPFHAIYAPKKTGDILVPSQNEKRSATLQNMTSKAEAEAEFLMDRYNFYQLTSTRYLAMGLKAKSGEQIGTDIALVGGVNYDYLPGNECKENVAPKTHADNRSFSPNSPRLFYLEGTKKEVEQITALVDTKHWENELLKYNEATEEHVMGLEGKGAKSILHIATHGYAFPEFDFKDTTIERNSLRYSYRYSKNPMVRSGLMLTGANWAWMGSDTLTTLGAKQNGILTALEVSQLNLKKTKLAVLSACETGLGKDEGNEGSFGLKRAFKLAGIEQMIVSLWSVPDKETMELMTLFYDDLIRTRNPLQSFEQAQKVMRGRYPYEPAKWAGFVLIR